MKLIVVKDYEEMSDKAAQIIADQIKEKPDSILGLATGSTPEGMYAELVKMFENKEIDFSKITTFNLDEYFGINPENEQSYKYFMKKHLLGKVNLKEENTNIPAGITNDVEKTTSEYDGKILQLGGIDIQVLGIGGNGHIGFNEPNDYFVGETHKVDLSQDTIDANSRFFDNLEDVPKQAITMGMKSIMQSKKILLLANGDNKSEAIFNSLQGPITPQVPASILQLHRDLIVIIDEKAASKLKLEGSNQWTKRLKI